MKALATHLESIMMLPHYLVPCHGHEARMQCFVLVAQHCILICMTSSSSGSGSWNWGTCSRPQAAVDWNVLSQNGPMDYRCGNACRNRFSNWTALLCLSICAILIEICTSSMVCFNLQAGGPPSNFVKLYISVATRVFGIDALINP